MTLTVESLVRIAMTNPINAQIASRLPALGLNQCMLTAGCLFQAVWNHQSQQPPAWGVKDYDVFYFDPDLSWEAENEVINAAQRLFQDLDVNIEVKNQPASTSGTASGLASHILSFSRPRMALSVT